MRLYIWDIPNILIIIAGSLAEAQEVAKKEGIEVEGSHQRAIELEEPTPALVVFSGKKKEV